MKKTALSILRLVSDSYKISMASMIAELEDLVNARVKIAPLKIRRAKFYLQLIYSISKSSSNVILKLGNITSCKSSLFCSVTVL